MIHAHTNLAELPPPKFTRARSVLGLDPGQSGGYAILGPDPEAAPLPWQGGDLDGAALAAIIRRHDIHLAVVEKVGAMPKQGVASTFGFGYGAGKLAGVLEALGIPYQLVTPQRWKGVVLAGTPRDKDAAIAHVRRKYPWVDLLPGAKRVPHDGIADAVCIAEWGWQA